MGVRLERYITGKTIFNIENEISSYLRLSEGLRSRIPLVLSPKKSKGKIRVIRSTYEEIEILDLVVEGNRESPFFKI